MDDMYDTLRDYSYRVDIKDQVALESMLVVGWGWGGGQGALVSMLG